VAVIWRLNEQSFNFCRATPEDIEWFGLAKHQLMAENGTLIRTTDFGPLVVTDTFSD
jgi:hypothetical protein